MNVAITASVPKHSLNSSKRNNIIFDWVIYPDIKDLSIGKHANADTGNTPLKNMYMSNVLYQAKIYAL